MATPEEPTTNTGTKTKEEDPIPSADKVPRSTGMDKGAVSSDQEDDKEDLPKPKQEDNENDEPTMTRPAKRLKKTLSNGADNDRDKTIQPTDKTSQVVPLLRSLQGNDAQTILEALSELFVLLRDESPGDGSTMALYHACGHSDILKVTTRSSTDAKLIVEAFFVLHTLTCGGRAQRVGFPKEQCELLRSSLHNMGTIDSALNALQKFKDDENVAYWSLSIMGDLLDCFSWTELFDQKIIEATLRTMKAHSIAAKIQRVGCQILQRAAQLATENSTTDVSADLSTGILDNGSHVIVEDSQDDKQSATNDQSGGFLGTKIIKKMVPSFAAGKDNSTDPSPKEETRQQNKPTTGIQSKFLQAGTMSVLAQVMEDFDGKERDHFTKTMAAEALQAILLLPK